MQILAHILLAFAYGGVLFDAYETGQKINRPGFREAGFPWRWLPRSWAVPGRVISAVIVAVVGHWAIHQGVDGWTFAGIGVIAAASWGAALWNRSLD
jgi:hypothetical protein